MIVDIYIEQSVKGPRRLPGAYGYVVKVETAKGTADIGEFETGNGWTAHDIELAAIIAALNRLKKPCEIHLHSSHGFFQMAVENFWLKIWSENGWKNSKGNEVENALMYQEIMNLIECGGHEITKIDKELGEYHEWLRMEVLRRAAEYKKELESVTFPE